MNFDNPQRDPIQEGLTGIAPASCDLLLQTLSRELDYVLELLGMALQTYILDPADDEDVQAENIYWDGWNQATQVLQQVRAAQQVPSECTQCRASAMSCISREPATDSVSR